MHVFLFPFQGTFVHFGGDILIRTEGTLSLGILKFETHPTIFNEEEQHTCLLESILGKTIFFFAPWKRRNFFRGEVERLKPEYTRKMGKIMIRTRKEAILRDF